MKFSNLEEERDYLRQALDTTQLMFALVLNQVGGEVTLTNVSTVDLSGLGIEIEEHGDDDKVIFRLVKDTTNMV